jgi:hypothetical protein
MQISCVQKKGLNLGPCWNYGIFSDGSEKPVEVQRGKNLIILICSYGFHMRPFQCSGLTLHTVAREGKFEITISPGNLQTLSLKFRE